MELKDNSDPVRSLDTFLNERSVYAYAASDAEARRRWNTKVRAKRELAHVPDEALDAIRARILFELTGWSA
jgi:hypothetical protein